jgi:HK97 gp10 family phage protein
MDNITGFRELSAQLSAMGASVGGKSLRSAAMSAALPVVRAIQAAAPEGDRMHRTYKGRLVSPGFLRRNIARKSFLSKDRTAAVVLIGPKSEAFYGKFLEFGTSKIPRRPFIEPAFKASIPAINARLEERLKELIAKAAVKK